MDDGAFWALIASARAAADDPRDTESVASALVSRLTAAGVDEVDEFRAAWNVQDARAYGWPLWGAAYLVNGGCSDDGFDYFIGWLIGQGQQVFEAAVRDPDSLAGHLDADDAGDAESEEMLGAASTARRQLTGSYVAPVLESARAQLGDEWDFDDVEEVRRRYPRLSAAFA